MKKSLLLMCGMVLALSSCRQDVNVRDDRDGAARTETQTETRIEREVERPAAAPTNVEVNVPERS